MDSYTGKGRSVLIADRNRVDDTCKTALPGHAASNVIEMTSGTLWEQVISSSDRSYTCAKGGSDLQSNESHCKKHRREKKNEQCQGRSTQTPHSRIHPPAREGR